MHNHASIAVKPTTAGPIVVKIGGNTGDPVPLFRAIAARVAAGAPVVLVHGGGPEIDRWLAERGFGTTRIDGLRVTDAATLAVTEAVLAGLVNKRLVRAASLQGIRAVGVSGADAALLTADPADNRALGYVGETCVADPALLWALLRAGYTPVVAPVAVSRAGDSALNVNADRAAAAIAAALRAGALLFVTDVDHVRRDPADPATAIAALDAAGARAFLRTCQGGMRPKLAAAIEALEAGVETCVVGDAGVLAGIGTRICRMLSPSRTP